LAHPGQKSGVECKSRSQPDWAYTKITPRAWAVIIIFASVISTLQFFLLVKVKEDKNVSDKIDLYSDRGVLLKSDVDLSAVSPLKNAAMQRLIGLTKRSEITPSQRFRRKR
jgi:hypothetical protein